MKETHRINALSLMISLVLSFWASTLNADDLFTGDIYLAGTNKGQLIFLQKNSVLKNGDQVILRHTYTRPNGELAVQEDVIFEKDSFVKYLVEFDESDCGCVLDRKGDKLLFGFTRGDTSAKGEADYTSNLVMGPTLTRFVHRNWKSLVQGETVFFYLPAMSLQRIARFRIYNNTESPWNRAGVIVLKMDLANLFLRGFLDPVDLVYDLRTKRLVEIHGKSLLQRRVNGKYENPVVDIYYRYSN
jgi:hypothetical protein